MAAAVDGRGSTFEVGEVKPLFSVRRPTGFWWYDVAPDGQRFLVNTTEQDPSAAPITLVVNWPAGLKK